MAFAQAKTKRFENEEGARVATPIFVSLGGARNAALLLVGRANVVALMQVQSECLAECGSMMVPYLSLTIRLA